MTYGCIVYQEQVIEIFRALAGLLLWARRTMIRRAISKKEGRRSSQAERHIFVYGESGGRSGESPAPSPNGVPEDSGQVRSIDEIVDFAEYAFNKAHAVCLCRGDLPDGLPEVPLSARSIWRRL